MLGMNNIDNLCYAIFFSNFKVCKVKTPQKYVAVLYN